MQKLCKEGANLGYFKKRGGRSCKQHQEGHWKTIFKNEFGSLKGGRD